MSDPKHRMADTQDKHESGGNTVSLTQEPQAPDQTPVEIKMAEIVTVTHGLDSKYRCERCDAQAYFEAQYAGTPSDLYFCRHHYHEHEAKLVMTATRIVDHEAFLFHQENMFKGGMPVK